MSLIRGNALAVPLADESVDLVVTSPPYFALRSYTDGGEHYDGQIGSEATPADFIAALLDVTRECVRVLKPSGSLWVNLGDKYAASHQGVTGATSDRAGRAEAQAKARRVSGVPDGFRPKSLMGLPWRYALGCIDDLGLILRAEVIWSKPNGLPESVTDRVRRSHEQWFHFTREPRYFAAVDEIREPHTGGSNYGRSDGGNGPSHHALVERGERGGVLGGTNPDLFNPLGKLPGSVRTVATEPLRVPDHLPQHFAAFPSEWPRWIITGWSPSGVCVACGEGRRPVTELDPAYAEYREATGDWNASLVAPGGGYDGTGNRRADGRPQSWRGTITGYACACPDTTAPTRPAVVLDPFCGTGTTVAVANALGRHGVGLDLSADYLTLARWRCQDPGLRAKVLGVDKPKPEVDGQLSLGVVA